MSNDPSLQTLWCQNSGMVNLYINGQLAVELPPALCAQLEKDLAAARRVPERARDMAQHDSIPGTDTDCVVSFVCGPISSAMSEADVITAWGGDPVASE